jgi:GTP diphosphokinase / guanosine-3',5'-bis(diphosphate) 3'-diphosphatase
LEYFAELKESLSYLEQNKIDSIYKAYLLAKDAHGDQKRVSGEPYITHPVAVASILAGIGMDYKSIIVALLHDVIEDTVYTKEDIQNYFDEETAELVDGVTKLTKIKFNSRAEAQAENFRKMLLAMTKDIRTIIIKLADRMHNMETVQYLNLERRRRISKETLEIYAPLARRLGMRFFSLSLENLGFSILYPLRYAILAKAMKKVQGEHYNILEEIKKVLEEKLKSNNVSVISIFAREKHVYSIYNKMKSKRISFSDITDFYAFRIIVDTIDDCYRALGCSHGLYKPLPLKIKDYIAMPKNNGYQSLHSVMFGPYGVPIEVQIRTPRMDSMAAQGIAAHWIYKTLESPNQSQAKAQQWLKDLNEIQHRTGNSIEFMENVKINLFPDDVYVFTPKGDILQLPSGATAMDFAYFVHTDVGNHCIAARIDKQLSPLSTVLYNGQTLDIIVTPSARPSASWLNTVVTGKARSAIRHYLKNQRKVESESLGLTLLKRAFAKAGYDFDKISEDDLLKLAFDAGFDNFNSLLEDVGLGNRAAPIVCQHYINLFLVEEDKKSMSPEDVLSDNPIAITGAEGMVLDYAPCCYPLPGYSICGILNAGQGISVHLDQCNSLSGINKDKIIPLTWSYKVANDFRVMIEIELLNKRGVLAMMALAISDAKASIEDINVLDCAASYSKIKIIVMLKDRRQLEKVIKSLLQISEINKVSKCSGLRS